MQAVNCLSLGKCGNHKEPVTADDTVKESTIKYIDPRDFESAKVATKETGDGSESTSSSSDDTESTPQDWRTIFEYRRTPPTIL